MHCRIKLLQWIHFPIDFSQPNQYCTSGKVVAYIVLFVECANKEGRKEMFLFNDALNTFYLRLYGVRHMVKDHSDSERGNPLLPHGLLFPINSKGSFICTIPDRIAHTTAFVIPVVDHWLEREITQWKDPLLLIV